jgi:hypothetical protein
LGNGSTVVETLSVVDLQLFASVTVTKKDEAELTLIDEEVSPSDH